MARPEILAHIEAEDALLDRSVYTSGWPHEAPDDPFTPDEAHRAMQRHAGCLAEVCARKRAAQRVLVEAKHVVPDYRRNLP